MSKVDSKLCKGRALTLDGVDFEIVNVHGSSLVILELVSLSYPKQCVSYIIDNKEKLETSSLKVVDCKILSRISETLFKIDISKFEEEDEISDEWDLGDQSKKYIDLYLEGEEIMVSMYTCFSETKVGFVY